MSPWVLLAADDTGKVFFAQRKEADNKHRSVLRWSLVEALKGVEVSAVYSRFGQMYAVTRDGRLFGWGFASGDFTPARTCSVGLAAGPQDIPEPLEITGAVGVDKFGFGSKPVRHVACGVSHAAFSCEGGEAFGVGQGQAGQLGNGSFDDSSVPIRVRLPDGVHVRAAAAGLSHTLFVTTDGEVFGCGAASAGELPLRRLSPGALPADLAVQGFQNWAFEPIPRRLDLLPGRKCGYFAVSVACGLSTSFFIGEDGSVLFSGAVLGASAPYGRPQGQDPRQPYRLKNLPRITEVSVSLNVPLKLPGIPFATVPEATEAHPAEVALFLAEGEESYLGPRLLSWGAPGGVAPRELPRL